MFNLADVYPCTILQRYSKDCFFDVIVAKQTEMPHQPSVLLVVVFPEFDYLLRKLSSTADCHCLSLSICERQ